MARLTIRVEGPVLDCLSLNALLRDLDQVQLVETSPDVVLLVGPDWERHATALQNPSTELALGAKTPGVALIVRGGAVEMRRARALGIRTYLSPESDIPQVRQGLKAAAEGMAFCCPVLMDSLLSSPATPHEEPPTRTDVRVASLSTQELRVALRAARGLSYRAIGKGLSIREATVKTHLQRVYAKLGLTKKAELRSWWPLLAEMEQERGEASSPHTAIADPHPPCGSARERTQMARTIQDLDGTE